MSGSITFAVTGDSILNRRVSVCTEAGFLKAVELLRAADVAFTHLETLFHDYDGPEVYPAAEAGWTWMRSPRYVADELKWMGFDIVSHASNHCLDYSYGGLFSTWQTLRAIQLPYAGTGINLGEARAPCYLETPKGRVALVSMCSSFSGWARAGEARRDVKGRPGLNPMRYHHVVDPETMSTLKHLFTQMGWWVTVKGKELLINPPGVHNAIQRFVESPDVSGVTTAPDEEDLDGNLRAIRNAGEQADFVLVHLHYHEFDPANGLSAPPTFAQPLAQTCIDAGAAVFIGQGCHAPLRGLEIYKSRPIFYDPGDFFRMSDTVTKLPSDYYWRPDYDPSVRDWRATPADAFAARRSHTVPISPAGGYHTAPVRGAMLATFSFGPDKRLTDLTLHPVVWLQEPRGYKGIPSLADPSSARRIISFVSQLSARFGTRIDFVDGIGHVRVPEA